MRQFRTLNMVHSRARIPLRSLAIGLALGLALTAASARADTISYLLTAGTLKGLSGPYAKVTVDRTSPTTATVTFDSPSDGGYTYLMGGQGAVDVNVNGPFGLGTISGSNAMEGFTPGPFVDGGKENKHRWGVFNLRLNTGGWPHSSTEITLQLTATGGNSWSSAGEVLLPNNKGQVAAIRLFACRQSGDGCAADDRRRTSRAFAGDAIVDPPPLTAVPIPAAAWLFGSGLLGLIAVARRRA